MKISLCLTTYNRYDFTVDAIAGIIEDHRISEIIILDDCSTDASFERLESTFLKFDHVHVIQQEKNVGMARNKRDAIEMATNEWAIIFDSDNVILTNYLDALENHFKTLSYNENLIFCPDWAKPGFDYRKFAGKIISKDNVKLVASDPMGNCMLNTCNYVVNRKFYLQTYRDNNEVGCADTIWHNLMHLQDGGLLYVVPGMDYFHRQHEGSGFLQNLTYNMQQAEKTRSKIQNL